MTASTFLIRYDHLQVAPLPTEKNVLKTEIAIRGTEIRNCKNKSFPWMHILIWEKIIVWIGMSKHLLNTLKSEICTLIAV